MFEEGNNFPIKRNPFCLIPAFSNEEYPQTSLSAACSQETKLTIRRVSTKALQSSHRHDRLARNEGTEVKVNSRPTGRRWPLVEGGHTWAEIPRAHSRDYHSYLVKLVFFFTRERERERERERCFI